MKQAKKVEKLSRKYYENFKKMISIKYLLKFRKKFVIFEKISRKFWESSRFFKNFG